MLIKLRKNSTSADLASLQQLLQKRGLNHCVSKKAPQIVIGLEKNLSREQIVSLEEIPCIDEVVLITTPYKLVSKAYKNEKTVVKVNDVEIGGNKIVLMAGPCAIESPEQLDAIATEMVKSGVAVMRGSAYKPRTSPYSFQGLGPEGLKMHKEAQKKHGMLIETEVMDIRDVALVADHVDIVRIGARNMQNFDLLKEVGRSGKPVILKRNAAATIEEWLLSAEYLMVHGCDNVILCERGIRTFENATRSTLDLSSVSVVKKLTHLPVIVDPSHAAGRKDIIADLCKAAVAVGADGLLVEVHQDPEIAKCDPKQALLPHEFHAIVEDLKRIAKAVGRSL